LVFGSSIAEGYWATERGWVQRLIGDVARYHVVNRLGATEGDWIMNLGVGGDTVRRVIGRFPGECRARIGPDAGQLVVVFWVGANDSMIVNGRGLSTPHQFNDDLGELYSLALEVTDRIMFIGFSPMNFDVDTARQFFESSRVLDFERVLRAFARDAGAQFVEINEPFQALLKEGHELLSFDGVHPNDAGHDVIYSHVKPALARWLTTLA
jgi:lysophospholipase L1-like esterase